MIKVYTKKDFILLIENKKFRIYKNNEIENIKYKPIMLDMPYDLYKMKFLGTIIEKNEKYISFKNFGEFQRKLKDTFPEYFI